MKLSDIMSYAQLTWYTEVALILFLGVFIAISVRTLAKTSFVVRHSMSMP